MRNRLILLLILLTGALAGLYHMRIPLLSAAFSAALQEPDIRLLHLAGLEIGWNGLRIEQLELGVGEYNARQLLEQVHLEYSLADTRLLRLSVSRANLSVPAGGEAAAGSGPLLTELAGQLMAVPLDSISVAALTLSGMELPLVAQPLRVQAEWDGPRFSLLAEDPDKQLHLGLQKTGPDQLSLLARLLGDKGPIVQFTATVYQQGGQLSLQGEGRSSLAALVPLLAAHIDIPELATAASGELVFQLSGRQGADLAQPGGQQWQLLLMPETVLVLALEPTEQAALDGDLTLTFVQPLSATLQLESDGALLATLGGEGVVLHLDERRHQLDARGELSALRCDYAQTLRCNSALSVQLQAPAATLEGEKPTTATGVELQLSAQLAFDDQLLTATLVPGELARVATLQQGDIRLSQPVLVADRLATLAYRLDSSQLSLQAEHLQLLLPRAETPQVNLATRLSLSGLEINHVAEQPLRARVHLSSEGLNLQRAGAWLPALAVEADIALERRLLSVKGQVRSDGGKPLFTLSAGHQLDSQEGSARILANGTTFDADHNRLSRHFSHWPFDWDLYQGDINADVDLSWRSGPDGTGIQGKINQHMEGIAGVYEEIGFIGLDGDFEADFNSSGQLRSTRAATLSLEALDVGVPVKDIQARFLLDAAQQQLTLQVAEAIVFGGRVWANDAVYRAGDDHNRIDIGVDGLQLGQLLALAGYDAVEGSGHISGLLPVDLSAAGVIMQRGMLAAKAPGGVFRYRAEVGAGTDPATAQVMKALSNYHYNIFQVEADYLESGDLQLQMLLRGHNPDYEQGRPIHLNLNVIDNIPRLLKSLQSGRVIADTISEKLGGTP